MKTVKLPLVGSSYAADSLAVAAQECVNLYPEAIRQTVQRLTIEAQGHCGPDQRLSETDIQCVPIPPK